MEAMNTRKIAQMRTGALAAAALMLAAAGCVVVVNPPSGVPTGDPPAGGPPADPDPPPGGIIGGLPARYTIHAIVHDDGIRRYHVYRPEGWDGITPLAAVLNFHASDATPETQAQASRMNLLADEIGFLVVYPEGVGPGGGRENASWNAGECCGHAMESGIDDIGFVVAVLDDLTRRYLVDRARVYATGLGAGAMMAHRVGVELADRVAAVAPVAGSLMLDDPPQPVRPVPVLHFHGLLDEVAPFLGGTGQGPLGGVDQNAIPDTVLWWIEANGADETPAETASEHYIEQRHEPLTPEGAPVVLIMLPEGGHTWPGGVDVSADASAGPLIEEVDAGRMMWEFFALFSLPE